MENTRNTFVVLIKAIAPVVIVSGYCLGILLYRFPIFLLPYFVFLSTAIKYLIESKSKKDYMIKLLITIGAFIICYSIDKTKFFNYNLQNDTHIQNIFNNIAINTFNFYKSIISKTISTIIISVTANRLVKNNWSKNTEGTLYE